MLKRTERALDTNLLAQSTMILKRFILVMLFSATGCTSNTRIGEGGHSVQSITFLSRSGEIACGRDDGTVEVWNVKDGRKVRTTHRDGAIRSVVCRDTSGSLLIGSADATICEWGANDGQLLWERKITERLPFIAIAPDEQYCAVADYNRYSAILRFFDITKQLEQEPPFILRVDPSDPYDGGSISAIHWDPHGRFLAALVTTLRPGPDHDSVFVLDSHSKKVIFKLRGGPSTNAGLAVSSQGLIASGSYNGVRVWDAATGRQLKLLDANGEQLCVAFSPDGRYLAAGAEHNRLLIWDTADWNVVQTLSNGGSLFRIDAIFCLAFSADGHQLASGSSDGSVCIWPLR